MAVSGIVLQGKRGLFVDTDAAASTDGATLALDRLPLLVQSMEATNVPKPGGKDDEVLPAYEVTFKAVLPEDLIAPLAAAIRDHRITVRVEDPGMGVSR